MILAKDDPRARLQYGRFSHLKVRVAFIYSKRIFVFFQIAKKINDFMYKDSIEDDYIIHLTMYCNFVFSFINNSHEEIKRGSLD
jgi:hypothetical protein